MEIILILLHTSLGNIELELYPEKAPATVANFVQYVKSGHYNDTIFHRVINGFMIQGGGFDDSMTQKPTKGPVKNEAENGLKNDVGTIAMARTQSPHSATAQFFINLSDNDFLNYKSSTADGWGYTVFGKVRVGMDVVEKIAEVKTGDQRMYKNVPVEPITIKSAEIIDVKDKGKTVEIEAEKVTN
jgi:peptidyl-prolyl cis-trans isomerase B (cyclophilin B)